MSYYIGETLSSLSNQYESIFRYRQVVVTPEGNRNLYRFSMVRKRWILAETMSVKQLYKKMYTNKTVIEDNVKIQRMFLTESDILREHVAEELEK